MDSKLSSKIDSIDEKFCNFNVELENLKLSHEKQEERLDYLEKEIRKRNVVFFGISDEEKSYFELEEVILKIITEKLLVECDKTEVQHVRRIGKKVPLDYCLYPLDKGDCHLKATPVFSYYKPGSRCEIEMWRGCPTFNKFSDEFLCSHYCIGKLSWDRVDVSSDLELAYEPIEVDETDECQIPMNEDDCGVTGEFRYTFLGLMCIRVPWKGCQSNNLFDDEETCASTCASTSDAKTKKQLDELPVDDVEAVNKLLDNIMEENKSEYPPKQKLMLINTAKTPYKPETTVKSETTTQTPESTSKATTEGVMITSEAASISVITTNAITETTVLETAVTNKATVAPTTEVTTPVVISEAVMTTIVVTNEATVASTTEVTNEATVASTTEVTKKPTVASTTEVNTPNAISEAVITTIVVTNEATVASTTEVTNEAKVASSTEVTKKPTVASTTEVTTPDDISKAVITTIAVTKKPTVASTTEVTTPDVIFDAEITTIVVTNEAAVASTTEVSTPDVISDAEITTIVVTNEAAVASTTEFSTPDVISDAEITTTEESVGVAEEFIGMDS
ncbi:Uncharacterized protein OBRU01_22525 [Operophtera brumata]|uniref:BPTI/Kunitz inhibitor domain-containing protein n=1 Tax=Operophtera brumata TaxID=104452 RepID=A0A0L7KR37_OPEBR|nr:Uncharacterized protein OBRU01_22525 [Operophtera brumata]